MKTPGPNYPAQRTKLRQKDDNFSIPYCYAEYEEFFKIFPFIIIIHSCDKFCDIVFLLRKLMS